MFCRTDTAQHVSGIIMPVIGSPSSCRCSLWFPYECGGRSVLSRGRLRTLPPPHSYGNQRLQRQFDGLLMMGIIMPETCWAVSVRQGNKILRLIVVSSWVFYLSNLVVFNKEFTSWIASLGSVLSLPSPRPCYAQILYMYGSVWQSAVSFGTNSCE